MNGMTFIGHGIGPAMDGGPDPESIHSIINIIPNSSLMNIPNIPSSGWYGRCADPPASNDSRP